jgi:hypothetical protein
MSLTSDKIHKNWEDLIGYIKQTFKEDYPDNRRERLLKMYHNLESRMMLAPASGRNYYHNCFPGGYVDHVLRVIKFAQLQYDLWESNGAYVDNYTREELIFVAMNHDLGKVGDLENDYYVPNDSEWHRKNQGKIYNHNPKLQYMTVPDRAIWLLSQFDIKLSEAEYLGIKLTDGLYDKANESYYISYLEENQLTWNLPHIVHQADMMASRIENENMYKNIDVFVKDKDNKKQDKKLNVLKKQFDELFN